MKTYCQWWKGSLTLMKLQQLRIKSKNLQCHCVVQNTMKSRVLHFGWGYAMRHRTALGFCCFTSLALHAAEVQKCWTFLAAAQAPANQLVSLLIQILSDIKGQSGGEIDCCLRDHPVFYDQTSFTHRATNWRRPSLERGGRGNQSNFATTLAMAKSRAMLCFPSGVTVIPAAPSIKHAKC